jgi:hypothetical protein
MVRAARNYVHPSDDLRPKILEAAREHCSDRRSEQKLLSFAMAVIVLIVISTPLIKYVEMLQAANVNRAAHQMQFRAAELATRPDIGSHWALAEAFSQWRHLQASRLGHADQNMK